jgi:hypothetical protein
MPGQKPLVLKNLEGEGSKDFHEIVLFPFIQEIGAVDDSGRELRGNHLQQ